MGDRGVRADLATGNAGSGPEWPSLPGTPGQSDPGGSPTGSELSELLTRRLLEQRVVLLRGPLDEVTVTRVSAELMTLDADGDDAVTLRIDCGEAALAPSLTLMDVVELMGVPVRAVCLGLVGGGAVGVLATCAHRAAMPSARFMLSEPTTHMEAHVRNVAQWAELRAAERARFCERVGAATGKPAAEVGADFERGRFLGAAEALDYGLLDEVCRPDAQVRTLPGAGSPPAIGFRPLR
jgi:ATP-dependent Clp protease protease subunit